MDASRLKSKPSPWSCSASQHTQQRGALTVELALLLPLLVFVLFGAFDLGRLLLTHLVLQHAVQQTARFALVRGMQSELAVSEAALQVEFQRLAVGLDANRLSLLVTPAWNSFSYAGADFSLQAEYPFQWAMWRGVGADPVVLRVQVQSVIAN